MCYLSRRERNCLKHAENGNPPRKAANVGRRGAIAQDVEAQVARFVAWCAERGRLPRQRSDDMPERQLAWWLNNFQKRGLAAATEGQRRAVRDCLALWGAGGGPAAAASAACGLVQAVASEGRTPRRGASAQALPRRARRPATWRRPPLRLLLLLLLWWKRRAPAATATLRLSLIHI